MYEMKVKNSPDKYSLFISLFLVLGKGGGGGQGVGGGEKNKKVRIYSLTLARFRAMNP